MKTKYGVIILATAVLGASAVADTYPTDRYSNRIAELNVYEDGPESPRLDNAYDGYLEGTVVLPREDLWELNLHVKADGEWNSLDDYVKIYINSELIADIPNVPYTPEIWEFPVSHLISGDSFTYRFEMHSLAFSATSHQQIGAGIVTAIPEPSSIAMIGLVSGFGVFVRRRLMW